MSVAVGVRARWSAASARERRRAIGLFGVSAAHAVNHMYGALLPLVYPIVQDQFHFSFSTLGVIIALSNFAGGVLQAVFGYINRRVSARRLLGWENVALSLCVALMAASGNVVQFGALRMAGSVAGSPQHPVGSAYCAEEFPPERRGFALAAHVGGGNIGTLIVPLLGAVMISVFGWRLTLVLWAIPIGLMGVLTFFLLQENPERAARAAAEPPDAGVWPELKAMLGRRTVVLILLAATIAAGGRGLGVITTYVPSYLQKGLGFGDIATGVLFNILLIGSVVGTLSAGRLSDRIGRKPMLIASYSAALVSMILLVLCGDALWALFPVLLALGITAYAETSVIQSFFADAIGTGSQRIGFGLFFTIGYGVGSVWAAVIGAVIDRYGFHAAFLLMGASYVAAALVLIPTTDIVGTRRRD
ncbi:MAG TPA: MFS transporter [Dehalococcoidia bacterium]